jgi:NADH pyrophosphatase NudC (nudix superfamily)
VRRGGQMRLACSQCGFVFWGNPVPVVAAVVERAGRVILVHSVGRPASWYGLVAGFLERGEHPEAAVLREVNEELGLEGRLASTIGIYPFERLNQVIFVYHVVVPADRPITLAPDELDDYQEVSLEKLRPWRQGTGPALRDWLIARGYDPPVVDFGAPLEL